jgi:hypothetical protein
MTEKEIFTTEDTEDAEEIKIIFMYSSVFLRVLCG